MSGLELSQLTNDSSQSIVVAAADVLAEAFAADPFYSQRQSKSPEALKGLLRLVVDNAIELGHEVTVATDGTEVLGTSWVVPSGARDIGVAQYPRFAISAIRAFGLRGAFRYAKDVTGLKHEETDDYLSMVGVAARGRGKGVGKALIDRVATVAAARNRGVSLETMNPENVDMYREKFGFVQVGERITIHATSTRGEYDTFRMRRLFVNPTDR
jgi:ribosomal protein S18 acetylase RimI-like enzyme